MKVIFLDVDGVIATPKASWGADEKYWHDEFGYPIDKDCVSRLNKILIATDAEIVFSSSWKLQYKSKEGRDRLFAYWKCVKSPIDATPNLIELSKGGIYMAQKRGEEIRRWIENNLDKKIERYLILDDDNSMLQEQELFFINTDGALGLTDSDVQRAIEILNT